VDGRIKNFRAWKDLESKIFAHVMGRLNFFRPWKSQEKIFRLWGDFEAKFFDHGAAKFHFFLSLERIFLNFLSRIDPKINSKTCGI